MDNNKELLPEPVLPIMNTSSPFLIQIFIFFNANLF